MNKRANYFLDALIKKSLSLCWTLSFAISLVVLFILLKDSFLFFQQVSLSEFLFGTSWQPLLEPKTFGVLPLVVGTLHIVVGSLLFAVPLSILVSLYLNLFAKPKFRRTLKPVLEVLAGIPTVVYGFFALNFITPFLQIIFPTIGVFNALSASIVVGIMLLPMLISLIDDAIQALPNHLSDGAYALGATKFEVSFMILLPAVSKRIAAAVVLALSRAIGETMAVTLAAGANPNLTWSPLESVQTLTAYIVQVSLGDTPAGGIEFLSSMAVALLLFLMTLLFNTLGSYWMVRKEYEI